MNIQIFGTQKSHDTKKALRFFKERRIPLQFVDLRAKKTAPGELGRFVQKFGLRALVNTASSAYARSNLEYLRLEDDALLGRLLADPALLVQPLVRSGNRLSLGWDEAYWREVVAGGGADGGADGGA